MVIKNISSHKILASMGDETVEATISFADGSVSTASVPAGISAGKYEIQKVPPDEALSQINQISQICANKDFTQETLDVKISSSGFGGNATLAVSAAFFKANRYLLTANRFPKLMLLLFEGGKHGNENLTIQEFLLIEESVQQASEDFMRLRNYLQQNSVETLVGAEGGFSPVNFSNERVIETIKTIFPNKQYSLDVAGSFETTNMDFTGAFSVEDPFNDESWDKFTALTAQDKFLVIGDDLTTTNTDRIKKAIDLKAINGVVIKPNQIGTISAAIDAVNIARKAGLQIVVSHRGDETNDTWVVDFALAVQADFVKLGGMDRGERNAKYNRLRELGMS